MGIEVVDAITELGRLSFGWFWVPLAHWTVLAAVGLLALTVTRSCHPLTSYRLHQALLVALPLVVLLAPWSPRLVPGVGVLPDYGPGRMSTEAIAPWASAWVPGVESSAAARAGQVATRPSSATVQGKWSADPARLGLGLAILLAAALAAMQLVILLRQFRDLRTLRSVAVPVTGAAARQALEDLSRLLGVRRPVELLGGPDGSLPLTFDVRRPSILVPRGIATDPERLRPVLAHELVHVRRRDAAWTLVERLVAIPFAFHPLVWVLAHRIERLRESSCDAEVVGSGVSEPRSYAELLYDMSAVARAGLTVVPTLLTRVSNLKERVESMKRFIDTPPNDRLRKRSVWASAVVCAATVTVGACGSGAPPPQQVPADMAEELTSRFGPMADETRNATLERLDVQMAYLQERVEEIAAEIRDVEQSGLDPHSHLFEQYQLLSQMYLQRLETYETLKLERETELRLGRR